MYNNIKDLNVTYLSRACPVFDDHNCEHVVQQLCLFLHHVVDVDLQLIDYQVLLLHDQLRF